MTLCKYFIPSILLFAERLYISFQMNCNLANQCIALRFNFLKMSSTQKESHLRSLLKGFTWRIVATTTTVTIAYFITGEIGDALKIGAIEFIGKIFIYYLHERAWQLAPRGAIRNLYKGSKGEEQKRN